MNEQETKDNEQATRNDNRLKAMLMGQPDATKFVALMIARVASPADVTAVLDQIRGAEGVNFERKVEGADNRPLRHFLNKSPKQLRDELQDDDKVAAVQDALRDAGLSAEPAEVGHSSAESSPEGVAKFGEIASRNSANLVAAKHEGETFGVEQYPASELWDLSDEELRAVEGVTATDITRLRQLKAAAPPKAAK